MRLVKIKKMLVGPPGMPNLVENSMPSFGDLNWLTSQWTLGPKQMGAGANEKMGIIFVRGPTWHAQLGPEFHALCADAGFVTSGNPVDHLEFLLMSCFHH